MDKKQLIWILILAGAGSLLLSNYMNRSKEPPAPTAQTAPVLATSAANAGASWSLGGRLIPSGTKVQDIPRPVLGGLDPEGDYKIQAVLDPRGAAVYTLKLAGVYDTAGHKRQGNKTPQQLQEWSYSLLNPVDGGKEMVLPFATKRISIAGAVDVKTFNVRDAEGETGWLQTGDVQTDAAGTQSVSFAMTIYRTGPATPSTATASAPTTAAEAPSVAGATPAKPEPTLRAIKTYSLAKGSSSLRVALTVENLTPEPLGIGVIQYGPTGMPLEDQFKEDRFVIRGEHVAKDKKVSVPRTFAVTKESAGFDESIGGNGEGNPTVWAGQMNKFFACLVYPVPEGVQPAKVTMDTDLASLVVPKDKQYGYTFSREVLQENPQAKTQLVVFNSGTRGDTVGIKPGAKVSYDFDVYCGQKNRDTFTDIPLYSKLDYRATILAGSSSCTWCTFDWLTLGVMWLIERGGAAAGNYGVIIIALVLVVRLLLHPITKKSQVSMMKLGKLGPEMEKIKQKFKDDKEAQQREMMKFMREQGASPFLGCLPMVLQMPIWIALWSGLSSEVAMRHAAFLPVWITNLAAPDTLVSWSSHPIWIPLISSLGVGHIVGLNLLPILLGVFMYLQQKLTPMSPTVTATKEQRQQQKIMMFMMTAMFLVIFYNAPSGLTLYMMGSIGGGVLESWVIRKHIREKEALEATTETRVDAPGKGARTQRGKKPKGPRTGM